MTENTFTLNQVRRWVADAILAGWTTRPLYNLESETRAAELRGGSFLAMAIMRPPIQSTATKEDASLCVWGADHLAVEVPPIFNISDLIKNLKVCQYCKAHTETPVRLGFAGRACPSCRTKLAPEIEYPGWCD